MFDPGAYFYKIWIRTTVDLISQEFGEKVCLTDAHLHTVHYYYAEGFTPPDATAAFMESLHTGHR